MSLRLKSFAIIAACMVVLMAMLYGVFYYLVTTRFVAIEEAETRLNVARVKDAIAQELVSLNSKAGTTPSCTTRASATCHGSMSHGFGERLTRSRPAGSILLPAIASRCPHAGLR